MRSKTAFRGRWLAVACAILAAPATAENLAAWRGLDQLRAHYERVPERELERLFLRCSRESNERMLGFDEAAQCSAGFEALKKRKFGGDFEALLAWWRVQRDAAVRE